MSTRINRLERHEEMEHGESMKKLGSSYYDGYDNRREDEREAGHMIPDDRTSFANMPQNVIFKAYPTTSGASYELDDTIKGVDEQNKRDGRKIKHERYPSKY